MLQVLQEEQVEEDALVQGQQAEEDLASAQAKVYATLDEEQQSKFDEVTARRGPGARGKHRGD